MARKSKKKEEEQQDQPKEKEVRELTAFEKEIRVVAVVVVAFLFLFSYFGKAGIIGQGISCVIFGMFGAAAFLLPFFMIAFTFVYVANRDNQRIVKKCYCSVGIGVLLMAFMQLLTDDGTHTLNVVTLFKESSSNHWHGGGIVGGFIANVMAKLCGELGSYLILLALFAIAFMYITEKLLFHNLKKKGSVAYERMKEKAENVQERQQTEELEEYSEIKEDKKGLAGRFFNFKKALQSDELPELENLEEELEASKEEGVVGDMKEIVSEEESEESASEEGIAKERAVETQESEKDEQVDQWDQLIIHRMEGSAGNESNGPIQEEIAVEQLTKDEPLPIHQQEILQKFAREDEEVFVDTKAMDEPEETKERNVEINEDFFDNLEANLHEYADSSFDNATFEIQKGEGGAGVVMDGMEEEVYQSPLEAMKQLSEPVQNRTVQSEGRVTSHEQGFVKTVAPQEKVSPVAPAPKKPQKKKYILPTPDLLEKPSGKEMGVSDEKLKENAKKLQETLESFGVGAKVTNVSCGPTVTRFELQPDQGVKVSKITALADDIKLNMAAAEIRIEAPIPGKAAVGIEVPNETNMMVHFRDLVENKKFQKHDSKIAFAVGKDIGGQVVVSDIAKMPHLLIAGATGSGKSVCINTLIMSILYKANPEDVKLIMIDPKVVELSVYKGIPHLLIPVVTEPKKASAALQWAVMEMTERYQKFAELGVRDVKGYNERIKAVEYAEDERFQKMPQIVIIVDELADLMMVASKEVEEAICRLAQLARAAGLHLVIATQRPSVNVITGLIKANVPSRIAFAVSSAVDSRTILDGGGAEKLLGKGDMLFYPSGFPKPVRVQGAFVSDEEVNRVVSFIIEKNGGEEENSSSAIQKKMMEVSTVTETGASAERENDDYFEEAGKFIIEKNKASIGMLQRVYKIGFNRAARIMDQLCEAGVVGPEEGTKPRKVLMTLEEFENR